MSKIKNFHVPLPSKTYLELRKVSDDLSQPATKIVKVLIELWLKGKKRQFIHQGVLDYAKAHAGTKADLDFELEGAAVEELLAKKT